MAEEPATGLLQAQSDDPIIDSAYDAEAEYQVDASRVTAAVSAHPTSGTLDDDEVAVPTEYLQDDLAMPIELPPGFRANPLATAIANRPTKVLGMTAVIALVATLWVSLGASERFSVEETLFRPTDDPDVDAFVQLGHGAERVSAASLDRRRLSTDEERDRVPVTLVFEKRGGSVGGVLGPRQLKAVHDIQTELRHPSARQKRRPLPLPRGAAFAHGLGPAPHWAANDDDEALCWLEADQCVPLDSLDAYLWPTVEESTALRFDGGMDGGGAWSCAVPPFGAGDVADTIKWLTSTGHDGFLATRATLDGEHASSPSLRATLYLDKSRMDSGKWYELAYTLWSRSASWLGASWYVKVWYGGPRELETAELLVALANDLWLLAAALLAILLYMRVFFGGWRLALLAALQILISLPLMYWIVSVLFAQWRLSAFAGASLWVVLGVSADNIFVLTETWGQSAQLERHGRAAAADERLTWTMRQAGVPLFFANATTAVSLLINCASSLPAIFQFGLCGGVLLFVNLALGLTWLPALLVLQERGAFDRAQHKSQAERADALRARMLVLQAAHRALWSARARVLAAFGVALLLLAPAALSLAPGQDASFTFSPDPRMQRVVQYARQPPPNGFFRAAEGVNGTGAATPSLAAAAAAAAGVPARYAALLDGTYEPPPPPSEATFFACVLALLGLHDAAALGLLALAVATDSAVLCLQPPPGATRRLAPALLALAALLAVLSLYVAALSLWLCDFAVDYFLLIGNCLGLTLLAHAALYLRTARLCAAGGEWGALRTTEWMANAPGAPRLFRGLAAGCALLGVLVLLVTDGTPRAALGWWGWGGFSFGWAWGPSGLAALLALLLLYDAAAVARSAQAAYADFSPEASPFRAVHGARHGLAAAAAALALAGWSLLVLSGLPLGADLDGTALSNAAGAACLANALAHAALWLCYRRRLPLGPWQPSSWARAHRREALGVQAAAAFAWTGAAVLFFATAHSHACDEDRDGWTSLGEWGTCLAQNVSLAALGLPSLPTPGAVALGLCLALLWRFDGLVAWLACHVLDSGEQYLCLAPLPPRADGRRPRQSWLYARLRLASAALPLLAGVVLAVSVSPAAFGALFGPRGIGASNLLALSLLLHCPPLTALLKALLTDAQLHMLAPTAWSERSNVPALLTFAADALCLVAAVAILVTQDEAPPLPDLAGADWHGVLLALLLSLDAHALLAAARVQLDGRPAFLFLRPLPDAAADELDALGDRLADLGGYASVGAFCAAWLALFPAAAHALFVSVRVLAVGMELLLCLHALLLLLLVHLVHEARGVFIFEPSAGLDVGGEAGVLWMRRLFGGGAALLGLAVLLPLLDGGHVWEACGNLVFTALAAGAATTHGLYVGELELAALPFATSKRLTFAGTCGCGVLCGVCYALAITPYGSQPLEDTGFLPPLPYLLLQVCTFFALVNLPPLAMLSEVWYTGRTVCGFDAEDAPRDRHGQTVGASKLLLATLACCVAGGAFWASAELIIVLDDTPRAGGALPEAAWHEAEECRLFWGIRGLEGDGADARAVLFDGFRPEEAAAQEELRLACEGLTDG